MNALADIRKALPEEAISYQAIWVWCVKGKVNAKQIDVAWYVEPDGFLSRWESKGFPPLQCPIS
jgi:elongation factor P hydroxylase